MSDEHYMREALKLAKHACSLGEVPVGAVVVKDGEIIGRGFNQPILASDPAAHAEVVAMREAGGRLRNYRLVECELYVTLEPCVMCAGAMIHGRLSRLIFGAADPKAGACGSVMDVLGNHRINAHVRVSSGVLAGECSSLLSTFFKLRRQAERGI